MDNVHVTMREKSNFPQHCIKFHMQIVEKKKTVTLLDRKKNKSSVTKRKYVASHTRP